MSDVVPIQIKHPYQGHYMEPAFLGFVSFASRNLQEQFVAECGEINLATDGIGKMIDKATGHDVSEVQRFMDWCVVQFGTPEQLETPQTDPSND